MTPVDGERERQWLTRELDLMTRDPLLAATLTPFSLDVIRKAHARIASLESQISALRADAERYRWLKDRMHGIDFFYKTSGDDSISALIFDASGLPVSANLDATIDAAIHSIPSAAPICEGGLGDAGRDAT